LPLERLMNEERFREDLFHRLSSVVVRTPPLRERREDISLICDREIMAIDFELRPQVKERFDEFLARNGDYAWPGNVRELKKVLRALAVGSSPETRGSGPARPAGGLPAQIAEGMMTMERARAWYAGHVLSRFQGNMSRAAKALDIDRATLRKLLPEKSHAS
jgi:DNA-binding NtrC family response regulator